MLVLNFPVCSPLPHKGPLRTIYPRRYLPMCSRSQWSSEALRVLSWGKVIKVNIDLAVEPHTSHAPNSLKPGCVCDRPASWSPITTSIDPAMETCTRLAQTHCLLCQLVDISIFQNKMFSPTTHPWAMDTDNGPIYLWFPTYGTMFTVGPQHQAH